MMKLDYEKLNSFDRTNLLEYEEEIQKRIERERKAKDEDKGKGRGYRR